MSTADLSQQTIAVKIPSFCRAVIHRRKSIAWLASAVMVLLAAYACTTVPVQHSIFDATQLRLLVIALSSVAASHLLFALNNRESRWHLASWLTVTAAWSLILIVT